MSANPHANGGLLLRDLRLPDFRDYAVAVESPGEGMSEATRVLGDWLRDVIKDNPSNFRLFGPDENRVQPARRHLRGDQQGVRRARSCGGTITWPPTAG